MIVIADSGSTKTDWCIGNSQTDYRIVQTPGINPFYLSTKEISRQITENLFPQLTEKTPSPNFISMAPAARPKRHAS